MELAMTQPGESVEFGLRIQITKIAFLLAASCGIPTQTVAQALIAWSSGPADARPTHNSPTYVAKNIKLIESRPFDGIVVNEFLGRNIFNVDLALNAPEVTHKNTGAIRYDAAVSGLSPLKGIFKVFTHNFVKVNMLMTSLPPLLTDDRGWSIVVESARNYSHAVGETGLRGVLLDNETYLRPQLQSNRPLDYWDYDDHLTLGNLQKDSLPVDSLILLARKRGQQLMDALIAENPRER